MKDILLPKPNTHGGMPLMDALSARASSRTYSDKTFKLDDAVDLQILSDLLWAAWGFNRERRRTAPSSHNRQETELICFFPEAIYWYDAQQNILICTKEGDFRAATGSQDFVASAPINIALVADTRKITGKTPQGVIEAIYANTGFISQNIYLFCASAGLSTVTRAMVDKASLSSLLGLEPEQVVTLVQSVGWPAEISE